MKCWLSVCLWLLSSSHVMAQGVSTRLLAGSVRGWRSYAKLAWFPEPSQSGYPIGLVLGVELTSDGHDSIFTATAHR